MKNKAILKLIIFVIAVLLAVILIANTLARYESEAEAEGEIEIAMYVLNADYQNMSLKLNGSDDPLLPRIDPYKYRFSISNFNELARTDVELEYALSIRTTTNLPLTYQLYKYPNDTYNPGAAENIIASNTVAPDDDGTFFRTIKTTWLDAQDIEVGYEEFGYEEDQINYYELVITFPKSFAEIKYQDIIESVEIIVNSKQKIT